ncbi:hypothetical protein ILFOPFJJ_06462 [Ensifer psoraleae]|nr:hypothetical protein [Sinorhizobium psoraleae]
MDNEVDLDITWRRIVPVSERTHRNRPPNRRTHSGTAALSAAGHSTHFGQEAIHGRCADCRQLAAKLDIKMQPAMPLKSRSKMGISGLRRFEQRRSDASRY